MATRHVYRHRIVAVIEREITYDPTKPESYQAALQDVATVRGALTNLDARLTHDDGKPVAIRESAAPQKQAAE